MQNSLQKYISTIGVVRYTRRWIYLECDIEIGRYYRSLISASLLNLKSDFKNKMWVKLNDSIWKTHVSIVRLEDFESLSSETVGLLWNKHEGKEIEIQYDNNSLETNGLYFWFPVKSDKLSEIRVELGLSNNPFPDYHITIGNLIQQ